MREYKAQIFKAHVTAHFSVTRDELFLINTDSMLQQCFIITSCIDVWKQVRQVEVEWAITGLTPIDNIELPWAKDDITVVQISMN